MDQVKGCSRVTATTATWCQSSNAEAEQATEGSSKSSELPGEAQDCNDSLVRLGQVQAADTEPAQ
jgi:hypothetical protein